MTDTLPDVPSSEPDAKRAGPSRLVVILLVGLVTIIPTWFSPLGTQKRNLFAAQRHADLFRPQIQADMRFTKVKIESYTAAGGCLSVGGSVNSKEDGEALRAMVMATHPPVLTIFRVFLYPPTQELPGFALLADLVLGGS